MIAQEMLDVTKIEPRFKHPRIFDRFDSLKGGESFTILNDHDPKPLYYQMLGERGNIFTWEYLENGPQTWQVRITRLTDEDLETVGEIAAKDLQKASVFKKYGIDFCCGGKKTLKQACEEKGVSLEDIKNDLRKNSSISTESLPRFQSWSLDFLINYIIGNHHDYITSTEPNITPILNKVVKVHGSNHPELALIKQVFEELYAELKDHMVKEEEKLFPVIKQLELQKKASVNFSEDVTESMNEVVEMLEDEHEAAGRLLEKLNSLTNNYTPPQDACGSYQMLYKQLAEFEDDLHQHIHLENNILFPKAQQLLQAK